MYHNWRAAKDSHIMFCCLEALLSESARIAIYAESDTYTFRRGGVPGAVPGGDGNENAAMD
jgi:hypothetical protein